MKTTNTLPKVIALLRVTTEEQAADDKSELARQQTVIDRAVVANNLDLIRTVTLVDVSKNNVFFNADLQGVLLAVQNREIDGVVVADQNLFVFSQTQATIAALDVFIKASAKLYTGEVIHDFGTSAGIFGSHISLIVAGLEQRKIRERIQRGKEIKRKAGECPSSNITLPQGVRYDRQAKSWSYTKVVAPIQEAFRLIDEEGMSCISKVARTVGIARTTLFNLLRNPIYMGWRVYSQSKHSREEPIRVRVINEPAVWPERFARVQSILDQKRIKQNNSNSSKPNNH